MSSIKFSPEQTKAIQERDTNIIVSAGAGSGKTAVLTERIKQILLSGVKANQLLVLTFTKAAAGEMKERIIKKMANDPILFSRISEVDGAYVTTFDSFSLAVVKKYHERLNLTKSVGIVDGSVLNVYKRKIMDEIFDGYYLKNNPEFNSMIIDLTPKDDSTLRKEMIKLANDLDLRVDKEEYLNHYFDTYYTDEKFEEYFSSLELLLKEKLKFIQDCLNQLSKLLDEDKYLRFAQQYGFVMDIDGYDQISRYFSEPINALNLKKLDPEVKFIKSSLEDMVKEINSLCIYPDKEYARKVYFDSSKYASISIQIVKEYDQKLNEYKRKYEAFEFSDIAKMAINLVKNNKDIADELKNQFYEILVDEYQDTSDLQEEFISYISKNNVYMVGDIKQSIYGFRNANPSIFKNKYDLYRANDKKIGIKIDLNQNFRSNRPVLKVINDIFDHVMDDEIGNANFRLEHEMRFGLTKYEEGSNANKIHYLTYLESDEYKKQDVEMFSILKDIQNKVGKEIVYDADSGSFRTATYKDFAILAADSSLFDTISRLLDSEHIPNLVFKNVEVNKGAIVAIIKNIIKLITLDYNQDYQEEFNRSYISVCRSFIFQNTDEEIFDAITNGTYPTTLCYQMIHQYVPMLYNISLKELIQKIVDDFDIIYKLIQVGDVDNNITRIEYLLNIADSMDKLELNVFDFITYIDNIFEAGDKMEFSASGENENKVKIMTIHKSKGLEFPIVYFISNYKSFNVADIKEKIIYNNKYGIIVPFFDNGEGKNINYILMKQNYYLQTVSEKLRLLYVALTRAREQIYIYNTHSEEEEFSLPLEDLVPSIARKDYRSFKDVYDSVKDILKQYQEEIKVEDLAISDDYLKSTKQDYSAYITPVSQKINLIENKNDSYSVEEKHASKETKDLFTKEAIQAMDKGTKVHELLESCDFIHYDPALYNEQENKILSSFLSWPLLANIKKGKIYKEFEFIYEENDKKTHGIIDLMIIYDDHIDIIDYKLKHVEDENYLKQLHTYSYYIHFKTNKRVDTYLYSILGNQFKKLDV